MAPVGSVYRIQRWPGNGIDDGGRGGDAGWGVLAAWGGRYGYAVTWRVLAYPLGYLAPLTAVPGLRWVASAYAGIVLLAVGLAVAREVSFGRAFLSCFVISGLVLFGAGALL